MESESWDNVDFDYPGNIPTMITREEKKYLFWLTSSVWTGIGKVVEIGPWLGGSTACLASGMGASGHNCNKKLVVFDNFIWRSFMRDRADLDLKVGDSFMPAFFDYISEYSDCVDAFQRSLPDEEILGDRLAESRRGNQDKVEVPIFDGVPGTDPIEILFVDGAKSWSGILHLIRLTAERLENENSIIVCQDFKYWGNYWVPLMMSLLRDSLEPIHNTRNATTVTFRVKNKIDIKLLEDLPMHIKDVPRQTCMRAIDHGCEILRSDNDLIGAAHVELGKVMLLLHQDENSLAAEHFKSMQAKWKWRQVVQLERARKYVHEQTGESIPVPFLMATKRLLRKLKSRLTRK